MLGLVCHFVEEKKKKNGQVILQNKFEPRILQLGRFKAGKYADSEIKQVYVHNLQKTLDILPDIVKCGIRLFRLSSNLLPLSDLVPRECWDNDDIKNLLKKIGQFIISNKMRICTHPGQFCVLSSDSDKVVDNAFRELIIHGWLFDEMGLDRSPKWAINIHGGKKDRASQLIERIESLPHSVRARLTLENDELAYGVTDLLPVFLKTGTPICFDSHHHTFNDNGLSQEEAFAAACETWTGDVKPLQHLSNTEPLFRDGSFAQRRKHSDMIHYVPNCQLSALLNDTIDVEIEAKMKNLSVLDMSRKFSIPL